MLSHPVPHPAAPTTQSSLHATGTRKESRTETQHRLLPVSVHWSKGLTTTCVFSPAAAAFLEGRKKKGAIPYLTQLRSRPPIPDSIVRSLYYLLSPSRRRLNGRSHPHLHLATSPPSAPRQERQTSFFHHKTHCCRSTPPARRCVSQSHHAHPLSTTFLSTSLPLDTIIPVRDLSIQHLKTPASTHRCPSPSHFISTYTFSFENPQGVD